MSSIVRPHRLGSDRDVLTRELDQFECGPIADDHAIGDASTHLQHLGTVARQPKRHGIDVPVQAKGLAFVSDLFAPAQVAYGQRVTLGLGHTHAFFTDVVDRRIAGADGVVRPTA